ENEEVRKKAKEIGIGDLDGQITYAKTLGLEFSKEDAEALTKEVGVDKKDELSEEELEKVAGGIVTSTAALVVGAAVGGAVIISIGKALSRW
ncbi:MAG: Blp family class II bacteriocin, partial [Synergistaceae bacterium]|nr:Blp family class II bacteriocin [Synergistaceae bacterium]